ncbi:signal peptidase I [Granulosicoccus sp.]|nr:signal peptidase I [Granulosicoccus sp.]MDB4222556.1 signal peptidase I [Granulosicoccus sp.]
MSNLAAPRRPWLAALLSLVLPGFGQFYVGDANRALGIFLLFALLGIPAIIIISLYLPIQLTAVSVALATLASICVWVFAVVDAWRQARLRDPFVPAAWQTRTVYTSVFLLMAFVLLPVVIGNVRQHLVQAFHIPSNSMSPTLLSGDMLFADMSYNCPNCFKAVKRGDVAIFVYPNNRTQHFVKRIVALPGDTIEIVAGEMIINGTPSPDAFGGDASVNMDERKVAPGHVFVLGDNRTISLDSRHFDDVPLSDVVGRPRQIWFSSGEDGVRWDRIGMGVQGGG